MSTAPNRGLNATEAFFERKIRGMFRKTRRGAPDHRGHRRTWYCLTERLEFDLLFQQNMIDCYPGMTFAEMQHWDRWAVEHCKNPWAPRYRGKGAGKCQLCGPVPEEGPIDPLFSDLPQAKAVVPKAPQQWQYPRSPRRLQRLLRRLLTRPN